MSIEMNGIIKGYHVEVVESDFHVRVNIKGKNGLDADTLAYYKKNDEIKKSLPIVFIRDLILDYMAN